MPDGLVVNTEKNGPTSSVPHLTKFSLEELATLNGASLVVKELAQRIILAIRTADETAVDVSAAAPLPVSMATGPLPAGAATDSMLAALGLILSSIDGKDFATGSDVAALGSLLLSIDGKDFATQTTLAAILAKLIATPATEAKQDEIIALFGALGVKRASGAALSNTPASVTSVTLLAANANRLGAMIWNDSATATLYVKFGAAATLTSATVKILPGGYYELPAPVYPGVIDGIWDIANGAARVTETT